MAQQQPVQQQPSQLGRSYISQAEFKPQPITRQDTGTVMLTLFSNDNVRRLSSSDFAIETKEKIALKWENCIIVLFYGENQESKDVIQVFSIAAQQIAGPIMGACNLIVEREVARAFTDVKGLGSHALHWASIRGYPFILTYRGGWPTAFYNGDVDVQQIVDWAMTLACEANYYERFNLAGGVQAEARYQKSASLRYPGEGGVNPIRTQSQEYRTGTSIRGYNSSLPLTLEGSQQAAQQASILRAQQTGAPVQTTVPQTVQVTPTPAPPPQASIPTVTSNIPT